MTYGIVLALHIIIACSTVALLAYSAFALVKGKIAWYKRLMVSIAALAVLETASGFLLAVLSPTVTVSYVASHLLVYLGVCLIAEAALAWKKRAVWIG
ncbi:MAG: hypothetical protein V4436_00135 [Patescibacteria group bacterium]